MTEPIYKDQPHFDAMMEKIHDDHRYLELRPNAQESVNETLGKLWEQLHPRQHGRGEILSEGELEDDRRAFIKTEASAILTSMWAGQKAADSVVQQYQQEQEAQEREKGRRNAGRTDGGRKF
jgi:hypothetical protein